MPVNWQFCIFIKLTYNLIVTLIFIKIFVDNAYTLKYGWSGSKAKGKNHE